MCQTCQAGLIGRRDALKLGAAGLMAIAFGNGAAPAHAAYGAPTALSPEQALAALKEGNARYVAHPELCVLDLAAERESVVGHQAPWATIIACADSRVPPELIFGGHGVGELFVARNAGNLVDTATLGTVEYGAAVLGSPLIVVLAHTACGAVKAACDVVTENATYPGAIGPMIEPIVPAALAVRDQPGDFVTNAAKESARRTAARLTAASTLLADRASLRQAEDRFGDLRPANRRGELAGLTGSGGQVGAQQFRPFLDGLAAAHLWLDQPVDREGRRDVNAVLAVVARVPTHGVADAFQFERLRQIGAGQLADLGDDLRRRPVHVRPMGVVLELEVFPVLIDAGHRLEGGGLAAFGGARRQDGAGDDPGKQMPGLRDEADLDGQLVVADGGDKGRKLLEGTLGVGAGGFEEGFEFRLAVTEFDRLDGILGFC